MRIIILLAVFQLFLVSCDEPEENVQAATSGLGGFWQGIIKSTAGNLENVTDITLSLETDNTFELTKLRTRDKATGTYDEFPQLKSLTLRVEDSDVQELALAGGIRDFEYQLYEGELLLSSLDSVVRLKRPQGDGEDTLTNVWQCSQKELVWQLSFVNGQFVLYLENLDGASLFMKGSYSVEKNDENKQQQRAVLFVEDGQPVKAFNQLTGTMFYEQGFITEISLVPTDEEGATLEPLECTLQAD